MSNDPKTIATRELDEVWVKGKLAAIDELYATNLVDHNPIANLPPGLGGLKIFVQSLREGFPDARFSLDLLFAEGPLVARRWTMTATHRGPFLGIPPTGKSITMTGIDLLKIEAGKIVAIWHNEDVAAMFAQLGVAPPG
jgi:steroid delta-isomerase-like uncharacterized protein